MKSRHVPLLSLACALAWAPACTWIGPQYFDAAEGNLDEDSDGCPRKLDCDDHDDRESCEYLEIPYDGLDNDCSGEDAVDLDEDLYPGIAKSAWEALEDRNPDLEWPLGVKTDDAEVDCRDARPEDLETYEFAEGTQPPTHASASLIHPGATDAEEAYDGVDQDCDGGNDFDQDADGYLPAADTVLEEGETTTTVGEAYDAFLSEWGYTFDDAQFGDCDDVDSTVNPGVTVDADAWYDGIDKDCAGNNDFDADADGYMPAGYDEDYESFLSRYYLGGNPPWTLLEGDDCLDVADANYPLLDPSTVHPGGDDVDYDGADQDCAGDNDFDADGDGYRVEDMDTEYEAYELNWSYTSIPTLEEGDCDDADAAVVPDALEGFDDGVDQDCDGDDSTTPFGFASMTWEAPRNVEVGITSDHYVVTSAADEIELPTGSQTNPATSMLFEPASAGYDAVWSSQPIFWQPGSSSPVGAAIDMVADGAVFYVSMSYFSTSSTLIVKRLEYNAISDTYYQQLAFRGVDAVDQIYADLDVEKDAGGTLWAIGCAESTLQFITASSASGTFSKEADNFATISGGTACFLDVSEGGSIALATVCAGDDGCTTYDLDDAEETITTSASQPWEDADFDATDTKDGWLIATHSGNGALLHDLEDGDSHEFLADSEVVAIDHTMFGQTHYVAAVLDDLGSRSVWLYWGNDLDGPMSSVELPFYRDRGTPIFDLVATDVAVAVDSDRLVVAVVGEDDADNPNEDAVGWLFLER